jgi:hypothetical protein
MRFTIRDLVWLTTVACISIAWCMQTAELAAVKSSAVLNSIRIDALTGELNRLGYLVGWFDDNAVHGPFVTYPHVPKARPPVKNSN